MARAALDGRAADDGRTPLEDRAATDERAALDERAARATTEMASPAGRLDAMTVDRANDHLGELVDAVVAGFAEVAVAQARAAERVEELRRWCLVAADVVARHQGKEQAGDVDRTFAERSLTAELGCALRLPERSAGALLLESKALVHDHPATMAALRRGAVSYRHAQTVLDATMGLDEPSVLELDALLAQRAQTLTVSRLKTVARRERERRDSRPLAERHQVAAADRHVELYPCGDGMAWLHHLLPAVQATAIFHRLTDIAVAVQGPDEPRTLAQLRADAGVDLLLDDGARAALMAAPCDAGQLPAGETPKATSGTGAGAGEGAGAGAGEGAGTGADVGVGVGVGGDAASGTSETTGAATDSSLDRHAPQAGADTQRNTGNPSPSIAGIADRISLGGIKPQVAVTIPVMTLLGHSEEPGDLAGHGPIDAQTARRLAAQAPSFLRILTHPETGTVLSVGRDRYAVPADLKTWLRIRDETCRFPGCSRRAQRCDIDHIKDWAHGGTTDHHNLIHLCRHHHRLKHTTGWTVRAEPPDRPATAPPPPPQGSSPHSNPPPRDSPHGGSPHSGTLNNDELRCAPRHSDSAPTADVVRWTAPTGRQYLDHAAQQIAHREAEKHDAPGTRSVDRSQSDYADEPPF